MRIVRFRSTKLVVRNRTTALDILQEASSAIVAKDDVELAVRTKAHDTAVVITPRRLTSILLQRAQFDQIAIECECRTVPDVPIDSISQERNLIDVCGVYAGAAFGPVQIHKTVLREVRMQSDSQQASLGSIVDCEIEWSGLQSAVDDSLNLAGRSLQNEEIVEPDKCDARRLIESGNHSVHG